MSVYELVAYTPGEQPEGAVVVDAGETADGKCLYAVPAEPDQPDSTE